MTSSTGQPKDHQVPPGTGTLGLALILLALGVLFAASIAGYLIIRYIGANAPARGTLELPWPFWLTTGIILCSGVSMYYGQRAILADQRRALRRALTVTTILGVVFMIVQTPAMYQLYELHNREAEKGNIYLFGLVLLLIALHALHVVGGLISLFITTARAYRDAYSSDNYAGVKHCAMYWHFLDIVWIVMFTALWATA